MTTAFVREAERLERNADQIGGTIGMAVSHVAASFRNLAAADASEAATEATVAKIDQDYGYDATTMVRMIGELERAVGTAPSGTDQGRWEHLLGRVGMLRAQVAELMTHPTFVVDAPGAPDKRVQALGMSIDAHAGMTETAGDTVARAVEFHRFLLGVHEHPSTPKTVFAIQGQDHVALRTRDDAIETLAAALKATECMAFSGPSDHAATLVDALLAVDG